jgi:hypothetical protein
MGYSNLLNHIYSKHPDYNDVFLSISRATDNQSSSIQTSKTGQSSMTATMELFYDEKSANIFKWLEWIIMDELPLSFCEKELTKQYTSLMPISTNTIKKYLNRLCSAVENKIKTHFTMCSHYALMFDGWTENSTHFIGMSALILF